jgi:serine protease Do
MKRILGAITGCLAGALLIQPGVVSAKTNPPPRVTIQDAPLSRDVKAGTSFAPVIKKVAPSVVNISSSMTIHERGGRNSLLEDPFFRRFFGDDSEQSQPRDRKAQSLGSGVIVSPDGYILTANHVVEGADKVKVALASGEREFDAKVVGTDPATDVAVLKIEAKNNLPVIPIADSDHLEVGDVVLAIGNPFAVGQTVTMGIVSGVGRTGLGITGYENFIQTDAAINPGNSGGALVDAEGRLVGINTAILSRTGGNMGIGFAVPANLARYVMDRLVTEGKVTRGYLGINIQPLTRDLAKLFHLPDESSGVMVGGVSPDSAAEKAGLQDGDVILDFNGKKVSEPSALQLQVAQTPPGSKVTLRILRNAENGKPTEKNLTATLTELPKEYLVTDNRSRSNSREHSQSGTDALDGVEVTDLDGRVRRQIDIPRNVQGALVSNVSQDSNAAEAGLRPGDVILAIDHHPVHNSDEAIQLAEKAKGEQILLQVWSRPEGRGPGGTKFLPVDNTKRK